MSERKFVLLIPVLLMIVGSGIFLCGKGVTVGQSRGTDRMGISHEYPKFYKGFYLNCGSGGSREKLKSYLERARRAGLNAVVIDVQTPGVRPAVTPKEHVDLCRAMGFHPIARVVVFPEGLKKYPAPKELLENRLEVAEAACRAGFREIQFDYIRFNDHGVIGSPSRNERYDYIAGFLKAARKRLSQYDIKIAADIFGRIPLRIDDHIGQKMEVMDSVVDVICPMAYPSHYTWSKKMMSDPYYTVHLTSQKARERAARAEIVTWIQAFQMKVRRSGLTYDRYVEAQLRAVHDARVKGFLLWNASQDYDVPLAVCENFYKYNKTVAYEPIFDGRDD
jgi:hypothetical protein